MATQITAAIFPNAEQWLTENMKDMGPDSITTVLPALHLSLKGKTLWKDYSEEATIPKKYLTMTDYVKGLQLLSDQIGRTLFVGCLKSPIELIDPGNWDAEVVDAFYQLCYYGEVIYG